MKLVLYGGGDFADNVKLNKISIALTGKKNPLITFVPSCSYDGEVHFREFVEGFRGLRQTRFLYFPIDVPIDDILFKEVLKSDLIHLSGGNTYYFLNILKRTKMDRVLKKFAQDGGVLSGLSAGGILMTPNIDTAGYPDFDKDENEENLSSFRALNLVDFEFFPHYRNSARYEKELIKQSKKSKRPIYGTPDGNGIVINKDEMTFLGKNFCFFGGRKIKIGKADTTYKL